MPYDQGGLPWVGGGGFMYKSFVVRCERCSRGNRQSQFKCWIVAGRRAVTSHIRHLVLQFCVILFLLLGRQVRLLRL